MSALVGRYRVLLRVRKVLITGDLGFIGRHASIAFERAGWKVDGIDKERGKEEDLASAKRAREIHLALRLRGTSLIVHLASSLSTPGSMLRPMRTFRDTVMTTVNVLTMARDLGVPVIITSSVKARDGKTPYGAAKKMVETWALEYGTAYDMSVVIDRPGTVYGPDQEGSLESGWVAWFLRARDEGLKVTIHGDGRQLRDLLHVDDYCRLLVMQAEDPGLYERRVWDVGGGDLNVVSVVEMADHLGLTYEFGPPRYGDSMSYIGENIVPGWMPSIGWRESGMFG